MAKQDKLDDEAKAESLVEDENLTEKIKLLKEKQTQKQTLQQALKNSGQKQISTVDTDARLLSKRGKTIGGYNVQIAVDSQHKIIVSEDVTQDGNDTHQLFSMLEKSQDILQSDNLIGLADCGYYEGEELRLCEDKNITLHVGIPDKSKQMEKRGLYVRKQFKYDSQKDCYICPEGQILALTGKPFIKRNKTYARYSNKTSVCNNCAKRDQCLSRKSKYKQIFRWQHEGVVERHLARMQVNPEAMRRRGALVEHPFGTIKHRAGMHHFLVRGLEKCQGEFSLMTLSYNFTRVLSILGIEKLRDYCAQRQANILKQTKYV